MLHPGSWFLRFTLEWRHFSISDTRQCFLVLSGARICCTILTGRMKFSRRNLSVYLYITSIVNCMVCGIYHSSATSAAISSVSFHITIAIGAVRIEAMITAMATCGQSKLISFLCHIHRCASSLVKPSLSRATFISPFFYSCLAIIQIVHIYPSRPLFESILPR